MILERFAYTPLGTFGRLIDDEFTACTMEEIWAKNVRSQSCIPEGTYKCRRNIFPRTGETFEVTAVPNRTAILFHVANTIANVEGCIGPGNSFGTVDGMWGVHESLQAYKRFMKHLEGVNEFTLEVRFNAGYP